MIRCFAITITVKRIKNAANCVLVLRNLMQNNFQTKIDGALGAMINEDQPTHSIYQTILAKITRKVNVATGSNSVQLQHAKFGVQ